MTGGSNSLIRRDFNLSKAIFHRKKFHEGALKCIFGDTAVVIVEFCGMSDCSEIHEIHSQCLLCWSLIGASYGRATQYFDSNLGEELQRRENWSAEQETRILESLGNTELVDSLFSNIIKKEFVITGEDKEIEENLVNAVPCFDKDPKKIIHYCYKIFGGNKDESGPSYVAAIQSLALNEFKEKNCKAKAKNQKIRGFRS
ncbi:MAG: hypothetical protein HXS48_11750 [Theionarchaea archaeon]|nr:MAG: hypothetical protein AYK19_07835 [Theionarchaea archaeon DG-70-1]MBU7027599.1 hypothetical protein [Theionarchaea archaeon]